MVVEFSLVVTLLALLDVCYAGMPLMHYNSTLLDVNNFSVPEIPCTYDGVRGMSFQSFNPESQPGGITVYSSLLWNGLRENNATSFEMEVWETGLPGFEEVIPELEQLIYYNYGEYLEDFNITNLILFTYTELQTAGYDNYFSNETNEVVQFAVMCNRESGVTLRLMYYQGMHVNLTSGHNLGHTIAGLEGMYLPYAGYVDDIDYNEFLEAGNTYASSAWLHRIDGCWRNTAFLGSCVDLPEQRGFCTTSTCFCQNHYSGFDCSQGSSCDQSVFDITFPNVGERNLSDPSPDDIYGYYYHCYNWGDVLPERCAKGSLDLYRYSDRKYCQCDAHFAGEHCDVILACWGCNLEQGSCVWSGHYYRCVCDDGFEGPRCHDIISACQWDEDNCIHGNCSHATGENKCICDPGYRGDVCEIDINECASQPCIHGDCIEGVDHFTCHCPGYDGPLCDIISDMCMTSPCPEGSRCRPLYMGYYCECPDDVTGDHCHIDNSTTDEMGEWGEWTSCSKSCDYGMRTRYRHCLHLPCKHDNWHSETCAQESCYGDGLTKTNSVLLRTYQPMIQFVEFEFRLREMITEYTNTYCVDHPEECCSAIRRDAIGLVSYTPLLTVDNVVTVTGYPRYATPTKVVTRVTVQATNSLFHQACIVTTPDPGNEGISDAGVERHTRAVTLTFLPQHVLHTIVAESIGKINDNTATCCYSLEDEEVMVRETPEWMLVLQVAVPVGVLVILVLIVFIAVALKPSGKQSKVAEPTTYLMVPDDQPSPRIQHIYCDDHDSS